MTTRNDQFVWSDPEKRIEVRAGSGTSIVRVADNMELQHFGGCDEASTAAAIARAKDLLANGAA